MRFFCEYCGYHIDTNKDAKCPNCGAAYNKNITYLKLEKERKENQAKLSKQSKKATGIVLGMFAIIPIVFVVSVFIISSNMFKNTGTSNVIKSINIKNSNETTKEEIQSNIDKLKNDISSLQESIDAIQAEIDDLNTEKASLSAKENQEFKKNGFSEQYYLIRNSISKLQNSIWEKESDIRKKKSQIENKQAEIENLQNKLDN